jgi:hypothetical protein
MKRWNVVILGGTAVLGALLAVLADGYSGWTGRLELDSGFAVGLDGVQAILAHKPPAEMEIGSFLGQYFIPLHGVGLYLAYLATRGAHRVLASAVFAAGLYTVAIGTSFHASLVYVAGLVHAGASEDVEAVARFFDATGGSMVALILLVSMGLAALIGSGRTLYPRWAVLVSPLGLMLVSTALVAGLPDAARDAREFLAIAGFNLPLGIFHAVTTGVLLAAPPEPGAAPS